MLRSVVKAFPAVVSACGLVLAVAGPAGSTHSTVDLHPDLVTKKPERLSIVTSGVERRLRFDNEVADIHSGPIELVAESADSDCNGDLTVELGERRVVQRIYQDSDGNGYFQRGVDTAYREVQAGCVAYHEGHDHSHYQDFASYVLVAMSTNTIAASSSKVTFCLADVRRTHASVPGSPASAYYTDCDGLTQGISVGWSDEYPYYVSGQHIVINPLGTYIGDGEYCLISTVDPALRLEEGNDTGDAELNNSASIRIKLSGNGTRVKRFNRSSCGGVGREPW